MTIILATLVDRLLPMIYVKIQSQGILSFGEQDFSYTNEVFPIQMHREANLALL